MNSFGLGPFMTWDLNDANALLKSANVGKLFLLLEVVLMMVMMLVMLLLLMMMMMMLLMMMMMMLVMMMMMMMMAKQMQFRDGEGTLRMNLISQMSQHTTWHASMIVHVSPHHSFWICEKFPGSKTGGRKQSFKLSLHCSRIDLLSYLQLFFHWWLRGI